MLQGLSYSCLKVNKWYVCYLALAPPGMYLTLSLCSVPRRLTDTIPSTTPSPALWLTFGFGQSRSLMRQLKG